MKEKWAEYKDNENRPVFTRETEERGAIVVGLSKVWRVRIYDKATHELLPVFTGPTTQKSYGTSTERFFPDLSSAKRSASFALKKALPETIELPEELLADEREVGNDS